MNLQRIIHWLLAITLLGYIPLSASEPFAISEQPGSQIPKQPQAFASADGVVHVSFGMGEQV
jgi:hypothetical protein